MQEHCDYLVLGSGVAGLTFALSAASAGRVLVLTKRERSDSSTAWAQGGISAVLDPTDSFDAHTQDTLIAGAGLSHPLAVELCVREAPEAIAFLRSLGATFDLAQAKEPMPAGPPGADLDLHLEGGHSARRIVHKGDMTGREVERALLQACQAHPNIEIRDHHMGVDLILLSKFGGPEVCVGAYVLDVASSQVKTFLAKATVLATGGAGKVYLYTSNPDIATGDGVAMAYRAGAEVANMEFYQFHPTCLYHAQAKSFLISEALRGEGALLKRIDGSLFMHEHDPRKELAPRDIVARAIDFEMKKSGADHVCLDITHRGRPFIEEHFPGIYAQCKKFGLDIAENPIPVVPAAHYMCGGITTNLEGRTTIPGLLAIGECAHTGLHGANRLASNSLLEGLVLGKRAAAAAIGTAAEPRTSQGAVPDWDTGQASTSKEAVVITQNWDELRRLMWNYVGIVRSNSRLERASRRIALLKEEIQEYYWKYFITRDLLELRNIATVAELIVECAKARPESRGLHATLDYPELDPKCARDTVIKRGVSAHFTARLP
jgi:L-aspartate oxidase